MTHIEGKVIAVDSKEIIRKHDPYEEVNFHTFDQCFKNLNDNYNIKDKNPQVDNRKT